MKQHGGFIEVETAPGGGAARASTSTGRASRTALLRGGGSRVDVLLSDVVMPGLSGVELARRVRPDRPGMPVVLMSGYSGELVAEGVLEGVLFLRKPIEAAALASTMRYAVEAPR